MTRFFFGTNIVVYAVIAGDPRQSTAMALLRAGGVIGVQTLNEYANVLSRKLRWDWPAVTASLDELRGIVAEIVSLSVELHILGLQLAGRYRLSIYDAMIVAAALNARCDTLYSEDMHDDLFVEGQLRIINPFRHLTL